MQLLHEFGTVAVVSDPALSGTLPIDHDGISIAMWSYCLSARRRAGLLLMFAVVLLSFISCQKAKSILGRADLPDMGPRLPLTVKMEFDPSLTTLRLPYINVCNAPMELRMGEELTAVLLQAAGQNFRGVQFAGAAPSGTKPDVTTQLTLQQSSLKIQTDGIYDRLPAEVKLETAVAFKDQDGRLLGERLVKTTYKERLIVEPTQHRCDIVSIDAFASNASVSLAIQFVREARLLLDPDGSLAAGGQAAPLVAQPAAPSPPPQAAPPMPTPPATQSSTAAIVTPGPKSATPSSVVPAVIPAAPAGSASSSSLSFKATVLDENGDGILGRGEQVKVRVEVVNAGLAPSVGVRVRISGTPAVVSQFPADTLPVGDLQPGESRSVAFTATLPQRVQAQRVELIVTASESSGASPASQTLVTSIRSDEGRAVRGEAEGGLDTGETGPSSKSAMKRKNVSPRSDVDEIPSPVEGYQQPQALLLAVGIGSYRDDQMPPRKFAAQDAELVAGYFQAVGGMLSDNVRVLQDKRALRPDIEEAVLDWLPSRATPDSVVIVYFSGQALVSPTGETFLVPYEGTRNSAARLYPLKDLQAALGKLKTRLTLLIFDGSVLHLGGEGKGKGKPGPSSGPQWDAGGRNIVRLIATSGFQAGLEPEKLRHGLFTYYLLRGLKGEADENQDGEVTLGELASFLSDAVPVAAKDAFRQDQQPVMIPPLSPTSKRATQPLARLANGVTLHTR